MMDRICARCGEKLQENDFLCPMCGAVYEQPACTPPVRLKPSEEMVQETSQIPVSGVPGRKWAVPLILGGILVLVAVLMALLDPFQEQMQATKATTDPTSIFLPTESSTIDESVTAQQVIAAYNQQYAKGQLKEAALTAQPVMESGEVSVWLLEGMEAVHPYEASEAVGGNLFYYAPGVRLVVYANDRIYTLWNAYRNHLQKDQLTELEEIHRSRYAHLYVAENKLPESLVLSQTEREYVCSVLGTEQIRLYYRNEQLLVVGEYSGFVSSTPLGYMVEDVAFLQSGWQLYVVCQDQCVDLSDAYQMQLLSYETLHEIYAAYRLHHPLCYYDYSQIPLQLVEQQILNEYNYAVRNGELDVSQLSLEIYLDLKDSPGVICVSGDDTLPAKHTMQLVGDRIFHYATKQPLLYYDYGRLMSLESARQSDYLSDRDVALVYQTHIQRNPQLYTPQADCLPLPEVDDAVLSQLRRDYARYSNMPGGASVTDVTMEIYGIFGEAYVGCFSAPWRFQTSETAYQQIEELLFVSRSTAPLLVYYQGQFYDLQSAVAKKLLTVEQLHQIAPLYVQQNLKLYYPEEFWP